MANAGQAKLAYEDVMERLLAEGFKAPSVELVDDILKAPDPRVELESFINRTRNITTANANYNDPFEAGVAMSKLTMGVDPVRAREDFQSHNQEVKTNLGFPPGFDKPIDLRVGVLGEEKPLTPQEAAALKTAQQQLGKGPDANVLQALEMAGRLKPLRERFFTVLQKLGLPTKSEELASTLRDAPPEIIRALALNAAVEIRKTLDREGKPELLEPLGRAQLAYAELSDLALAAHARSSAPGARSSYNEFVGDRLGDANRDVLQHPERMRALSTLHSELFPRISETDSAGEHRKQLGLLQRELEGNKDREGLKKLQDARARMAMKPWQPPVLPTGPEGAAVGTVNVRLEPQRVPLNLLMGYVSGDCIENCDVKSRLNALNDDRFVNWRMIHEGRWVGNVYTVVGNLKDGTPAIMVDAIQPEPSYRLKPADLAGSILNALRNIADKHGYAILFSNEQAHWSNRKTMQNALEPHLANKPTTKGDFPDFQYMYGPANEKHILYHLPAKPREMPRE